MLFVFDEWCLGIRSHGEGFVDDFIFDLGIGRNF